MIGDLEKKVHRILHGVRVFVLYSVLVIGHHTLLLHLRY